MKFIQTGLLIGVCAFLFSCKSDNDLSGSWIGAYLDPESSSGTKLPLNWLVEVSDDELKVSTLQLDGVHVPNRLTSIRYRRKGNQLLLYYDNKVDSVNIISRNDDSVVLQYHEEGESQFVFKRFYRGPSPEMPTLTGKSFRVLSGNYPDSISFINDSILINISRHAVRGNRWATTSVGSHSFLLLGDYGPPLYLKSVNSDTMTFENFSHGSNIALVMLNDRSLSLEGRWEEVGRLYAEGFPPPPRNGRMELTFDRDSCAISYGANLVKRRWKLNSTAEILFFDPDTQNNDRDWAWYVEKAGDSLIIDRRILFKDDAIDDDSGEKIIFIKRE